MEQAPVESVLGDDTLGANNGTQEAVQVSFVPDAVGNYVVSLVVSDGVEVSSPDLVVLTVNAP